MRASAGVALAFAAAALLGAALLLSSCKPGPARGAPGSACASGGDCREGLSCLVDFPGGYCTAECDGGAPCPEGTECRDLSGLMLCMQTCDAARDCRDEYRCNGGICDLPCASDADCPVGELCDLSDGTCLSGTVDCSVSPLPVGCACADDGECGSGDCLPPTLGGVCTAPCTDEQACGVGLACGVIVVNGAAGLELSTTCLPENPATGGLGDGCVTGADCRDTLCYGGRCTEVCEECAAGYDCRASNYNAGGTTGPLDLCIDATLSKSVIELGGMATNAVGGTGEVTFVLPAGSVAFTIVGEISAPGVCLFPQRIVDPAGTEWYDVFGGPAPLLRPLPGFEVMTVLVPDNDVSPPVLDGEWTMTIASYDCASFLGGSVTPLSSFIDRLAVVVKPYYDGVLDVNIHFTPGSGVSAASASGSLWVTNFVNEFWFYYAGPGVGATPGTVRFFDAPSTYNTISGNAQVWDACASLSELGPAGGPAVNVVVVGGFGGSLSGVAGIASGSPGSMLHAGVPMSCVCVEALTFSSAIMGVDMAHEVGHFLSMKHTSEFGGASCGAANPDNCFDAISDTGECSDPTPTNSSCPDFTNVMFPTLNGVMTSFSAGQENVLSGTPVLQ